MLLDHNMLKASFLGALDQWAGSGIEKATVENLFRCDPSRGFPQRGLHLTAFATALFAELVLTVTDEPRLRVAYRSIPEKQQPQLHAILTRRIPKAQIDIKEAFTIDFATISRAKSEEFHCVDLALESEMLPLSGDGSDPDEFVGDLVKLCSVYTGPKVFLCRANSGNERVGGKYVPKIDRFRAIIGAVLEQSSRLPIVADNGEVGVIVALTDTAPPWVVHTAVLDPLEGGTRKTSWQDFQIGDANA